MQKTSLVNDSLLFRNTSSCFLFSHDFISGCVNTHKDELPARDVGAHPPSLHLACRFWRQVARIETWFHRLGMCWRRELGRVRVLECATSSGFLLQPGRPPFYSCDAIQPQQGFTLNPYLLLNAHCFVCILIANAGRSATKVGLLVLLLVFLRCCVSASGNVYVFDELFKLFKSVHHESSAWQGKVAWPFDSRLP